MRVLVGKQCHPCKTLHMLDCKQVPLVIGGACLADSQGGAGGCASSESSSSSSSMAAIEQQLGVKPQDLMQRLMSRPDLLAKVQDPEVSMTPTCG